MTVKILTDIREDRYINVGFETTAKAWSHSTTNAGVQMRGAVCGQFSMGLANLS